MNRIHEIFKWLLKAWPVLVVVMIGIAHYSIYYRFQYNGALINKATGSILQLIGGLVVLYSINKNMGMFKQNNLLSMVREWFKTFPLIKRHSTLNIDAVLHGQSSLTGTLSIKRKSNTIEEKLEELERRIEECRQLIFDKEKVLIEKINSLKSQLENTIAQTIREIQDVKKLLDDSIVGSIKTQIFGVLLVIYGAVLVLI